MLIAFKIFLVPTIIALISLAGRIWGSRLSGMLGGLPVIVGPILVFLTLDHGANYAQTAAAAALAGVVSIGLFCFVYAQASRHFGITGALFSGVVAFFLGTTFFVFFQPNIWLTFALSLLTLIVILKTFPEYDREAESYKPNTQDVLLRMVAAAILVVGITFSSAAIGPRLSGLLAPFPIAGTILAGFTHYYSGSNSARKLLDGFLRGLYGMAIFHFVFALGVTQIGLVLVTTLAALLALCTSAVANKF